MRSSSYLHEEVRRHKAHHLPVTTLWFLLWLPSVAFGAPATSTAATAVATSATPVVTGNAACPIPDCVGLVGLNSTCLSQKTCVCASSSKLVQCFPKLGNCTGENAAEIEAELANLCSTQQEWGAPFPWAAWGSLSSRPEWGAQTQSLGTSATSASGSTGGTSTVTSTQSSTPTLTPSATPRPGGLSKRTIIAFSVSLGVTSFFAIFGTVCCLIRKRVQSRNAPRSCTTSPCDTKGPEQHVEAFPYTPHARRPVSQDSQGVTDIDDMACSETGENSIADSHSPLCGLSAEARIGSATSTPGSVRSGEGIETVHARTAAHRTKSPKTAGVPQPEDVDARPAPPSFPLPTAPAHPSDAMDDATPNPDPSSVLPATAAITLPLSPVTLQSAPSAQAANGQRYVVLPWALGERILSTLSHVNAAASPHPPLPTARGMQGFWDAVEGDSEGSLGPPPEYDGPPGLPGHAPREGAAHDS
ncbi:hypothetical protein C8Q73DRAFT_794327 [Cubamyces lactineus]|nr:hypothetical protein C8Q73DRAFT_794327 [Cubamyces lactineus]